VVHKRPLRALLALASLVLALSPSVRTHAQTGASCDDLSQQIAATDQHLNELKLAALPWLVQAGQFGAAALGDLAVAASSGAVPGLTPGLAESDGAIAGMLGAQIDGWRTNNDSALSNAYLRDLAQQTSIWDLTLASLAPVKGSVGSLIGLDTALMQLDQVAAAAQGDLAIRDGLSAQMADCPTAASPTPAGAGPAPEPTEPEASGSSALCEVGGQLGNSNSECFRLEYDAAFGVWEACTEAYFAAEDDAFRTGGDPPTNTCDGALQAEQDALQKRWSSP
jgi:hypothetical protein